MADKLLAAKHYDSKYIKDRKDQVIQRRQNLKGTLFDFHY